ncbi:transposase [Paramicrobacterium sp. CJ85]|uniref:transposase n=1 Tax=Paramicrobacterium sp. CJ85 TaxID=3445355 RepID=UPI003F5E5087
MAVLEGAAWRDLPERFGSWNPTYKNFRRWAVDGVWEDLLTHLQKRASLQGEIDWVVSVDSSIVRVHQHLATLPRDTGGLRNESGPEPPDHAIGSRGGLTTKIHSSATDGTGAVVRPHRWASRGHEHVHRRARRDPRSGERACVHKA